MLTMLKPKNKKKVEKPAVAINVLDKESKVPPKEPVMQMVVTPPSEVKTSQSSTTESTQIETKTDQKLEVKTVSNSSLADQKEFLSLVKICGNSFDAHHQVVNSKISIDYKKILKYMSRNNPLVFGQFTALQFFAIAGSTEGMEYAVKKLRNDPAYVTRFNVNLIMCVLESGSLGAFKYAVELLQLDKEGLFNNLSQSAFQILAERGSLEVLRYISSNISNINSNGLLLWAAKSGSIERVEFLHKEMDANPKYKSKTGESVLAYAVSSGSLTVVEYACGTLDLDPREENNNGLSVFQFAVQMGKVDVVRYLHQFAVEKYGIDLTLGNDAEGHDIFYHKDKIKDESLQLKMRQALLDLRKGFASKPPCLIESKDSSKSIFSALGCEMKEVSQDTKPHAMNPSAPPVSPEYILKHTHEKAMKDDINAVITIGGCMRDMGNDKLIRNLAYTYLKDLAEHQHHIAKYYLLDDYIDKSYDEGRDVIKWFIDNFLTLARVLSEGLHIQCIDEVLSKIKILSFKYPGKEAEMDTAKYELQRQKDYYAAASVAQHQVMKSSESTLTNSR